MKLALLELRKPVILALNMMDIVEERHGDRPAPPAGDAGRDTGGAGFRQKAHRPDVLLHAVVHHYEEGPKGIVVHYDDEIGRKRFLK